MGLDWAWAELGSESEGLGLGLARSEGGFCCFLVFLKFGSGILDFMSFYGVCIVLGWLHDGEIGWRRGEWGGCVVLIYVIYGGR